MKDEYFYTHTFL